MTSLMVSCARLDLSVAVYKRPCSCSSNLARETHAGTKVDVRALMQENQELKESLSHLRVKYEDLMAYMKERCYADDGERQR
jgi:hypothetical protein